VATEVAALVPLEVICDLLGIPIEDQERFVWWGTRLAGTIDGPRSLTERAEVRTTLVEMTCFFTDLIARYRRDPADNLISALACTTTDEFGERDLIALVELLFVAGLETTANLIGDIVRLLLEYPSQKALLLDDPGLAGNVVEEVLRFDPPTKFTARMAAEQVEVAGQMIPQGGFLFELLAGANRDPRVFTDPHRFDITRSNSRENISFSAGVHHCIGSGLARLEAEITVREIFERFPDMRMTGPARIRLARSVRGPYALAVEV
jgi:cytochrome P450